MQCVTCGKELSGDCSFRNWVYVYLPDDDGVIRNKEARECSHCHFKSRGLDRDAALAYIYS